MSIVGMRKGMSSWFRPFMLGLAVVFAIGLAFMGLNRGNMFGGGEKKDESLIAKVNGDGVIAADFWSEVGKEKENRKSSGQPGSTDVIMDTDIMGTTFDSIVDKLLVMQAAKNEGIKISNRDVNDKIDEIINEHLDYMKQSFIAQREAEKAAENKKGKDAAAPEEKPVKPEDKTAEKPGEAPVKDEYTDEMFKQDILAQTGKSVNDYKKELRGRIDPVTLKLSMTYQALIEKINSQVDASEATVRATYDEVKFKSFFVTDEMDGATVKVDAKTRADEAVKKINGGTDFDAVAKDYSSTKSSVTSALTKIMNLQPSLSKRISALQAGKVSEPIQAQGGFQIIKMLERKSAVPEDFDKKKEDYIKQYRDMKGYELKNLYFDTLHKNAKIEIFDPELRAYVLLRDIRSKVGDKKALKETLLKALEEYDTAIKDSGNRYDVSARANAQKAEIYRILRMPDLELASKEEMDKYRAAQKEALEIALQSTESSWMRITLADIAIEEKRYDDAVKGLTLVSGDAYNDLGLHQAVLARYENLKKVGYKDAKKLIADEEEWIAAYNKRHAGDMPQTGGLGNR